MKYRLVRRIYLSEEIEAKSAKDATKQYYKKHKQLPEIINDINIRGFCSVCLQPDYNHKDRLKLVDRTNMIYLCPTCLKGSQT